MIAVNGWCAGGKGEGGVAVSVQSMGEVGKDFCPNFLQPFLETLTREKHFENVLENISNV